MTSIGDKLTLQLPLTSVTQSLEQIAGDAAINVAKSIGSSDASAPDSGAPVLPSAGIATQQSAPSNDQTTTDSASQRTPSDGLMGTRPPSGDSQTFSFTDILQTAQLLASLSLASGQGTDLATADESSASPSPATSEADAGSTSNSGNLADRADARTIAAATSPVPATFASDIDQRPGAAATEAAAPQSADGADGTRGQANEGSPTSPSTATAGQTAASDPATPSQASGSAAQGTAAAGAQNPQTTTTVDARLDGSVMVTEIVNRPDAPQLISAAVTSNAMASALNEAASKETPTDVSEQERPQTTGDIVTWQVGHAGATSFAAIDVGAKQSAAWSDARDQSRENTRPVEDMTRPAAESNGFDAPRPKQSIETGALIGAVLSGAQPDDTPTAILPSAADRMNDATADLKTGIASSGILNAAMIPGWPQPNLAGKARTEDALAQRAAVPGMTDEEMLTYLANLGADEATLAKVKKALKKPVAGRKMAFYLASLATALSVVFKSLAGELEAIIEEDAETLEARKRADVRGKKSRRDRLYLE